MQDEQLQKVIEKIDASYREQDEIFFTDPCRHMPDRDAIIGIIKSLRNVVFPGYFDSEERGAGNARYFIGNTLLRVEHELHIQVREALLFRDGATQSYDEIEKHTDQICDKFIERIPDVQEMLYKDVQAAFDGDPAAKSKEDVIISYPGPFAIYVYRFAHELYVMDVPLIPRIMTEYAHSRTGVDINSGAVIGEYFFIDHATGVVIGETTVIGDHVKIYQGVTLGALSTRAGQRLAGVKRHPTIEDDVTIYSNASVLGGETVIGKGSVIAGSAFVTKSVPPNSRVSLKNQEVNVRIASEDKKAGFEVV